MEDTPSELTKNNLEEFLQNDTTFVDYFNTFLSLPCFPERIFYNKENDLLEQFTQQLVKDESDNVQVKYDASGDNVQISYSVTVLEKKKALEWLKKYRLSEFIKSGLYAEYKLSKTLSSAQAMYIDTIKNDLTRSSRPTEENPTSTNDEYSFSTSNSVFTTFDECEADEFDDVFEDYVEDSSARDVEEVHEKKSENPSTFHENVSNRLPIIIVTGIETNSAGRDGEEVSVTTDTNEETCVTIVNNSSSVSVKHDVISDDVTRDDVTRDCVSCNDVVISCALGDDVNDVKDYGATGADVIDNGALGDEVIGDYVIDNDNDIDVISGDDVIASDKPSDDGLDMFVNNQSPSGMELERNKIHDAPKMAQTETNITKNNSSKQDYDNGGISALKTEKNIVDTEENLEGLLSETDLSKIEAQTSYSPSSNGINNTNKMPQKHTNSIPNMLDASNMSPSDINFQNVVDQTHYDTYSNRSEKEMTQDYTNTGKLEHLQLSHDVKILKMEEDSAWNISDNDNDNSDRSFTKRPSSSNYSSDLSEFEQKSSITEQQEQTLLNNGVDLSSKEGMDKFKEFLVNTKGEALLFLWLQVETWKHLGNRGDKIRFLQEVKEQFFRNGSPLELPNELKKQAGRYFTADFSETQKIVAEPLRCYWCPRFTLHQFKTQATERIQCERKAVRKTWSSGVQSKSEVLMYPSKSPHLVRPHSCPSRETSHSSPASRETSLSCPPVKPHTRSKSAHGRVVSTPCHTNAGKKQLEIYATPPPVEYGFVKRPVSVFPPCNEQQYLSPVRLVISPRCKPQSRTAWSQRPEGDKDVDESHQNETSDNTRQDSLVDSLMRPSQSGCFFKEFVSKQNNQLWSNCLSFWQAVLEYTAFFESDTLNPVTVSKKAQWIYARFIRSGSISDIKVDRKTQEDIRHKLDPPYEELFDCVEEHVLVCLKEPWDSLCRNERREYDMIPKQETVRYLEVRLKRTRTNSKNSSLLQELESEDGRDNSERGKYSIEDANHPRPSSSDGMSFENVIKDRDELEGFQKYLEKKDPKGVMDLMAWTEMETFQRIPRAIEDKRNKKAKEIRQAYLNSRYFFGPDSPATKDAQNLILSINGSPRIKERPSSSVITECQKYVRCRIERRWLALYKASQEYKERQSPKQNVSEVVEDIMLRRRLQRSEAAWRVLNSRWVSSSRDIVALRQTLSNPESCLAFRKFVALKGDTYENDVLFWIEIQKYKDLCHRHASEQCIKKKIQAITDCFITSSIPPELQVDVPIEMAEKLMERITSRNPNIGPYLFREVQMTVFRVLFNMWKDFSSFRSSINDENLLKVLDKRLSQHRAEVKAKKEASERRKLAKQEAERKRKEKEEKEKKELKSMEQLMSLMTETSNWEQEENDVVVWKYSKHISATSEPTLRVKKVSTQDGSASFMELTNQRSVATKSTNQITTSLESQRPEKASKSKRYGSFLADSTYSAHSKHSMKETNSTVSRIPRINQSGRNSRTRDITRYDIIDKHSSKKMTANEKQQTAGKNKLLKNRAGKKSKKIVEQEIFDSVSNVGKDPSSTEQGIKDDRIKSPTIKDSRRRDSPTMERTGSVVVTERPGGLRTSVLRRQWNESHGRSKSPVPLTSQLLYDFTNSPEGAPLDTPLSLTRINLSDDVSVVQSSDVYRKTPPTSARKIVRETTLTTWRKKRANRRGCDVEQFVPDVIVN